MDYTGNENSNGNTNERFGGRLGRLMFDPQAADPTAYVGPTSIPEAAPAEKPGFFESIMGGATSLLASPAVKFAAEERARLRAEAARKAAIRQSFALTTADAARSRAAEALAIAREAEARRPAKKAPVGLIIGGVAIVGVLALVLFGRKRRS